MVAILSCREESTAKNRLVCFVDGLALEFFGGLSVAGVFGSLSEDLKIRFSEVYVSVATTHNESNCTFPTSASL